MSQMTVVEETAQQLGFQVVGHVGPACDRGWIARWYAKPGRDMLYIRYTAKGVVSRAAFGSFNTKTDLTKIDGKNKLGQIIAYML